MLAFLLWPSSLLRGELFAPEGQRARNKRQRQDMEDKGGEEGSKKRGQTYFSQKDKVLPLDRKKIDMAHRKMVYKGKGENLVLE